MSDRKDQPTLGTAIKDVVDLASDAVGTVGRFGRVLDSRLHLPGAPRHGVSQARAQPGARPGLEGIPDVDTPPPPGQVRIQCIDYGPQHLQSVDVDDLAAFLNQPRSQAAAVRWINIDGLHPYVVNQFKKKFGFHTLAAEDVVHVPQRPKVEPYDDHAFIIARMLMLIDGQLAAEQVSIFHYADTIITFQEQPGDVWQPVRQRIELETSRLRNGNSGYLLYALLDAVVDQNFPILEHYGDRLETIEDGMMKSATTALLHKLHEIKRELTLLRRVIWPLRDVIDELQRSERHALDDTTRTYLRDVHEHAVQIIDIVETYREMGSSLTDLYMSAVSNRMNEVMKVLTIMASFFIPITFVAGVYGMNFEVIPELKWRYAYACFWGICAIIVVALLFYFYRKGWIGGSQKD